MSRSKVLYRISKDTFIQYTNGKICLNDQKIALLPLPYLYILASRIRILTRLLRIEPRDIEKLTNNQFVVCALHKTWLLDIHKKSIKELVPNRKGWSNPLNLCTDGKCVYWGDYGNNEKRESVNIYRLNSDLKVEVVYSFYQGIVRHVHNIVWDKMHHRFFILTGDMEKTSGIYVADSDWRTVEPVVTGRQQYRAVAAFPCRDGLIYATDSVTEENQICLLQEGKVIYLCSFPGSCIYGTETKSYYVFASTVEPPEGRGFFDMFTYKLGSGIKDRYSHLVIVNKKNLKVKEILKVKKDIWPMKLLQYGTLMFSKGQEGIDDELWYYVMACKGDGHTKKIMLY